MLEREIIPNDINKEYITCSKVESLLSDRGLIIAYDKNDNIVGHVALNRNGDLVFTSIEFEDEYNNLSDILSSYSLYTFKFITNEEV
jgi:hypothetical protein